MALNNGFGKKSGMDQALKQKLMLGFSITAILISLVVVTITIMQSRPVKVAKADPLTDFYGRLNMMENMVFMFVEPKPVDGKMVMEGIVETAADLEALKAKVAAVQKQMPEIAVEWKVKIGKTPMPVPREKPSTGGSSAPK
ncbi:MAG: hypothetical protein IBJ18_13200 [Phycisphaerales bacterium]|nr:hypothetical protein [Phycisphaerales bacterium]